MFSHYVFILITNFIFYTENLTFDSERNIGCEIIRRDSCATYCGSLRTSGPTLPQCRGYSTDGMTLQLFPVCSSFVCFRATASTENNSYLFIFESLIRPKNLKLLHKSLKYSYTVHTCFLYDTFLFIIHFILFYFIIIMYFIQVIFIYVIFIIMKIIFIQRLITRDTV